MVRIHNIHLSIDKRKFLRKNSTPQEILLWSRIKNSQLGVKFRRQHGIGAYVTDFYCPAKKLVVEIDGSQHYGDKSIEYDTERSNYFASLNMDVLRFSNMEINTNIEGVLLKIKEILEPPPLLSGTPPR